MQAFRNRRRRLRVSKQKVENDAPLLITDKPHPVDVVFGRAQRNPGTELLHHLVKENFEEYESLDRGVKMKLVETVMHTITAQGGRFLQETVEPGGWHEISHEAARERISKCFRNHRRCQQP